MNTKNNIIMDLFKNDIQDISKDQFTQIMHNIFSCNVIEHIELESIENKIVEMLIKYSNIYVNDKIIKMILYSDISCTLLDKLIPFFEINKNYIFPKYKQKVVSLGLIKLVKDIQMSKTDIKKIIKLNIGNKYYDNMIINIIENNNFEININFLIFCLNIISDNYIKSYITERKYILEYLINNCNNFDCELLPLYFYKHIVYLCELKNDYTMIIIKIIINKNKNNIINVLKLLNSKMIWYKMLSEYFDDDLTNLVNNFLLIHGDNFITNNNSTSIYFYSKNLNLKPNKKTLDIACKIGNYNVYHDIVTNYNILPDDECLLNIFNDSEASTVLLKSKIMIDKEKIIDDIISRKIIITKHILDCSSKSKSNIIFQKIFENCAYINIDSIYLAISNGKILSDLEHFNIMYDDKLYYHCYLGNTIDNYIDKFCIDDKILTLRKMCKKNSVTTIENYLKKNKLNYDRYCFSNALEYSNTKLISHFFMKNYDPPVLAITKINNGIYGNHGNFIKIISNKLLQKGYIENHIQMAQIYDN